MLRWKQHFPAAFFVILDTGRHVFAYASWGLWPFLICASSFVRSHAGHSFNCPEALWIKAEIARKLHDSLSISMGFHHLAILSFFASFSISPWTASVRTCSALTNPSAEDCLEGRQKLSPCSSPKGCAAQRVSWLNAFMAALLSAKSTCSKRCRRSGMLAKRVICGNWAKEEYWYQ